MFGIKEVAASIGTAVATETIADADFADLLANGLENLADSMDEMTKILEAYASKEDSDES